MHATLPLQSETPDTLGPGGTQCWRRLRVLDPRGMWNCRSQVLPFTMRCCQLSACVNDDGTVVIGNLDADDWTVIPGVPCVRTTATALLGDALILYCTKAKLEEFLTGVWSPFSLLENSPKKFAFLTTPW